MFLSSLLTGCSIRSMRGDLDVDITGIAYDSRKVEPGFVFVAIQGVRSDGNRFVPQARSNGAVAIISATPGGGTWIEVDDDREALATVAANFYGHPTRQLELIGVTGTNGKTTTTYIIESVLKAAGHPAAVLGTIEYRGPGFQFEAERTTPEAPD